MPVSRAARRKEILTSPISISMRIVLCYPVEPKHIDRIQAAWPEAEIIDAGQDNIARELPTADIFCGHPKVPVPWDETIRGGRLQWIQSSAAGLDHCLVPSVIASSVPVTSASGVLSKQVADQTLALLANDHVGHQVGGLEGRRMLAGAVEREGP